MRRQHAVRYLLLKHLWLLRHHVSRERHREIAESLRVDIEPDRYVVRWQDRGTPQSFAIAREQLLLYERGDVFRKRDSARSDRVNEEEGEAFARHAFGMDSGTDRTAPARVVSRAWPAIFWSLAVLAAVAAADERVTGLCLLLAAAMAAEFVHHGRTAAWPLLGMGTLVVGLPYTAILGNGWLAVLHFLDPDRRRRGLRVGAALLLLAAGVVLAGMAGRVPSGGSSLLLLGLLAAAVVIGRSLIGVHLRLYPLVFPVLCAGLVADGHPLAAGVGILGAGLGLLGTTLLLRVWPLRLQPA